MMKEGKLSFIERKQALDLIDGHPAKKEIWLWDSPDSAGLRILGNTGVRLRLAAARLTGVRLLGSNLSASSYGLAQ